MPNHPSSNVPDHIRVHYVGNKRVIDPHDLADHFEQESLAKFPPPEPKPIPEPSPNFFEHGPWFLLMPCLFFPWLLIAVIPFGLIYAAIHYTTTRNHQ